MPTNFQSNVESSKCSASARILAPKYIATQSRRRHRSKNASNMKANIAYNAEQNYELFASCKYILIQTPFLGHGGEKMFRQKTKNAVQKCMLCSLPFVHRYCSMLHIVAARNTHFHSDDSRASSVPTHTYGIPFSPTSIREIYSAFASCFLHLHAHYDKGGPGKILMMALTTGTR